MQLNKLKWSYHLGKYEVTINNHTTIAASNNIISPSSSYSSITPLQQQHETTV